LAPETQNHWLKNGDRRRRNGIKKLVKEDGGVVVEEKELHELITNFYKDLFRSAAGTRYDELVAQVQPKVTASMNQYG
jgi:hypothetical protein